MESSFEQRRFFTRHSFHIVSDGVAVTERGVFSSKTYKVPFENIAGEPAEVSVSSKASFWAMAVLFALALFTGVEELLGGDVGTGAYVFYATFGLLAAASFALSRETFLVFREGDPPLVVFKDKPDKQAVADFIADVHEQRRQYLITHYMLGSDAGSAADAIHKLAWLREQGIITEGEFGVLKWDVVNSARGGRPFPISMN